MTASSDIPAVRFQDVTKRFGDFTAVDGVSFEVPQGSIFGILGSNGAGKTTSIRMLMNIFKPDGGRVEVFGTHVDESLKPKVGYLPEERGLYKKMRIEEMLRFFGRIKGRDDAYLNPSIDRWLEWTGLSAWRDRKVEALSKGMSQKLQFVATVIHGPELLVLDEPFAGLDPVNRDVLRDAVLKMHQEGTTIVFSTHVMEQAEQLCQRLIMLHGGQVQAGGTLDEVRAAEGRQAAHVRYKLRDGQTLDDLPGVTHVADHGNEAELTLAQDADGQAVLHALLARGAVTRFDLREPSLHEIFKRVAGATA
jgi:ABC-2 type transport system ATP-binding protein